MAQPSTILPDEPSMGLAPQIVEEIFGIVRDLNQKEGELPARRTEHQMRCALPTTAGILENGRVVMDGAAADLAKNEDVKEFYLGLSTAGRSRFGVSTTPTRAGLQGASVGEHFDTLKAILNCGSAPSSRRSRLNAYAKAYTAARRGSRMMSIPRQ
jgi:ABC-type multidrug transport system ATPase subunit